MPKVFVYGTLKPGGRFYPNISDHVSTLEAATAKGRMYSVGGMYPAVKFDTDDTVYGVVLTVNEAAIKEMDFIEGHPRHYERIDIEVFYGNRTETVQSYEYRGSVDRLERFEDGEWVV